MTANTRTFGMATACLFAASCLPVASAQDPGAGIVRISDSKGLGVQQASHGKVGEYHSYSGQTGFDAHGGGCPICGGSGCDSCGKQKCKLFGEHYCSHSPDHGYSIPGKWPIQRRGVQYQQLFPNAYYSVYSGAPGAVAAPQVYMPTDTTQLGYYYQHVPFWQPHPNPLPQRPVPAQWHSYAPVVYASQYGQVYSKHGMNGYYEGEVIYDSTSPTTSPGSSPTELQPVPDDKLPPQPVKESAVPLPIQRAGY